jgi:hypothetical protein
MDNSVSQGSLTKNLLACNANAAKAFCNGTVTNGAQENLLNHELSVTLSLGEY